METVTLSTRGQLVIPSGVREALRLRVGSRLKIMLDDGSIVLKPESAPWVPLNPKNARLSAAELSQPVDFTDEARGG